MNVPVSILPPTTISATTLERSMACLVAQFMVLIKFRVRLFPALSLVLSGTFLCSSYDI
jgi:hypothetical protein